MEKVELKAKIRDIFGRKTKKGRNEGLIPAVVYGRGIETTSLWINALDFKRLLKKTGESTMVSLSVGPSRNAAAPARQPDPPKTQSLQAGDSHSGWHSAAGGGKNDRNVIIYEIQRDPVTDSIIHIDFFQVKMDEEIETEVEFEYIGESIAVRDLGGVLVKNMDDIEVKCLPGDLPSKINVDISVLNTFDDRICVKNLKISEKVKIDLDPETVVALVSPPRSEEELDQLSEKVEEDVSKVEGVVKEEIPAEGEEPKEEIRKEKKDKE
jgi:large subunit ribosomal protein L25